MQLNRELHRVNTVGKIFYSLSTALILSLFSTTTVTATVLEYDEAGSLTVSDADKDKSKHAVKKASNPKKQNAFRILSRNVGLEYSGKPGVIKAGLDAQTFVDVFEALIHAESGFDPNAVSEKGAIGLGQLLPGTAQDMKVKDPFDPHQNLIGSAKYLTQQLYEFGSLELALAAYNAGPDRVRQFGDVPPFPETQKYIVSVFSSAGLVRENPSALKHQTSTNSSNSPRRKGEPSVWEY